MARKWLWASFVLLLCLCLPFFRMREEKSSPLAGNTVIENYTANGTPLTERFEGTPQRVVAVWQDSVETILALGAGDSLVAAIGVPYPACLQKDLRTAYAHIPLRQMEIPSTEGMLMLAPDLIVGWSSTFAERGLRGVAFWQGRGIRTYIVPSSIGRGRAYTVDGEMQYILDMGKIFHREAKAESIVQTMEAETKYIAQATAGRPKPHTLILEKLGRQYMTYGKNTLAADILRHAAGDPITLGRYVGEEAIVEANPEVIFVIVSEGRYREKDAARQEILDAPALQNVRAVQEGRVYVLPLYLVYASATRTIDGIHAMGRGLYPDLFAHIPAEEAESDAP